MIQTVKKIFSTDIVKVTSLNAVSTLVRMLTAFVSVKVVAVLIGPAGIALLGQLNNFSTIFLTVSAGGINTGMTKYIAEDVNAEEKYTSFISTGLRITFFLSLICGLVLVFGSSYFAQLILHDINYKSIFYIFGFTIILYAFNAFLLSVINGFSQFKKFVIVNIAGSFIGLLFSVILAVSFGIYGALISLVTYQSIIFLVTLGLIYKEVWFKRRILFNKFSKEAAIKLSHYSMMAIVSAVAVPASQLIIRNHITNYQSIEAAGLWEGINRISSIYLLVITTSLSVYYLPRIASLKTKDEIRKEVFSVYKILIPFLVITSFTIYIFRNLIIHILFNNKFNGMQDFFAFQLAGDFFKMTTWVLGYLLLAKAMTKTYIITELVSSAIFVLISIFCVNIYGTVGATIGYAISFFIYLILMTIIFRKMLFNYE